MDLKTGLKVVFERLEQGGRLVVINLYPLEDRVVKHFIQALAYPEQSAASRLCRAPLHTHELPTP